MGNRSFNERVYEYAKLYLVDEINAAHYRIADKNVDIDKEWQRNYAKELHEDLKRVQKMLK